jgi:hypothetical protein
LDEEFKSYHLSIVDLIGEESIDTEQGILDDHDDKVASLSSWLQQFISKLSSAHSSASMDSNPKQHLTRRLSRLERDLKLIVTTVDTITPGSEVDTCMLQQYEEQLSGLKAELARISTDILMLDEEDAGLSDRESALSKSHFEVCLKIRRLLQSPVKSSSVPTPTVDRSGVKLPKLDVPTFDGNVVNWISFWEQFLFMVEKGCQIPRSLHICDTQSKTALENVLWRDCLTQATSTRKPLTVCARVTTDHV